MPDRRHFERLEQESFDRPRRRTRPRTKDRPAYDDAKQGIVLTVDRGRFTCDVDGVSVMAMKSRPLGRKGVVVGDRVRIVGDTSGEDGALARIVEVEERRSVLRRTADDDDPIERVIVANATQLVVVVALADPEPRVGLVDRALVAAYDAGLEPLLVLTKADLASPDEMLATYGPLDVPHVVTKRGDDVAPILELLRGEASVFLGHSGVGKSTLVNALVPGTDRATGVVNAVTGRGRHTSTSALMLRLPHDPEVEQGWIIDTPGIRSFGLAHVDVDRLISAFPDLDELHRGLLTRLHARRRHPRVRAGRGRGRSGEGTRRVISPPPPRAGSPSVAEPLRAADVIIVGAGGSGAPLAARLSEDERCRVLVEAGPAPRLREDYPHDLLDAVQVPGAVDGAESSWWFPAHLASGHAYRISRGRFLGGSTTTNGGYFQRPRRTDFERWEESGGPAWSYDAMLPLMRSMENDADLPDDPLHGSSGPMPVSRTSLEHPAVEAFREGARALGIPDELDKNGEQAAGFGPVPTNTILGTRWNTGLAYLLPAMSRQNLHVRGNVRVRRVLVEANRAIGVEVEHDHRIERIFADHVVLLAGAYATPHVLMHSGIGRADALMGFGIPVLADLPGVGAEIEDHPDVINQPPMPSTQAHSAHVLGSWIGAGVNYHLSDNGEVEVLQSLVPMQQLRGFSVGPEPLPLLVSVRSAAPAGQVRLVSADPSVLPHVDYDYLADADARRRLREAVRFAAGLVQMPALGDDETVDRRIAAHLGTAAHACGGASFSTGVTDVEGRVTGVEGLRVADTSLLPGVPSRGPAATAVLIGEYVAATMRA